MTQSQGILWPGISSVVFVKWRVCESHTARMLRLNLTTTPHWQVIILISGLIFLSKGFAPGTPGATLLTSLIALIVVTSTLAFVVFVGFEVFRSIKYAKLHEHTRRAEAARIERTMIQKSRRSRQLRIAAAAGKDEGSESQSIGFGKRMVSSRAHVVVSGPLTHRPLHLHFAMVLLLGPSRLSSFFVLLAQSIFVARKASVIGAAIAPPRKRSVGAVVTAGDPSPSGRSGAGMSHRENRTALMALQAAARQSMSERRAESESTDETTRSDSEAVAGIGPAVRVPDRASTTTQTRSEESRPGGGTVAELRSPAPSRRLPAQGHSGLKLRSLFKRAPRSAASNPKRPSSSRPNLKDSEVSTLNPAIHLGLLPLAAPSGLTIGTPEPPVAAIFIPTQSPRQCSVDVHTPSRGTGIPARGLPQALAVTRMKLRKTALWTDPDVLVARQR